VVYFAGDPPSFGESAGGQAMILEPIHQWLERREIERRKTAGTDWSVFLEEVGPDVDDAEAEEYWSDNCEN
jgi:hypothetical protein